MRNLSWAPFRMVLMLGLVLSEGDTFAAGASCAFCPIKGVDAKASKSVGGVAKAAGPCTVTRAKSGIPLPDPKCTPGAFNPTVPPSVFGSAAFRTKCVRDCKTSPAQKKVAYTNYGLKKDATCELDHLVPLEMGGADSLDNIWPQCGKNAQGVFKDMKDEVENYLSIKVILGMDVDEARRGIATDWTQYIVAARAFCASQGCDVSKYRK